MVGILCQWVVRVDVGVPQTVASTLRERFLNMETQDGDVRLDWSGFIVCEGVMQFANRKITPARMPLLTKRKKRCRRCEHIVVRPEVCAIIVVFGSVNYMCFVFG